MNNVRIIFVRMIFVILQKQLLGLRMRDGLMSSGQSVGRGHSDVSDFNSPVTDFSLFILRFYIHSLLSSDKRYQKNKQFP